MYDYIIGPFLGAPNPGTVKIIIGIPEKNNTNVSELFCALYENTMEEPFAVEKAKKQYNQFGLFEFQINIENKPNNKKVYYKFYTTYEKELKSELFLGESLNYKDCFFYPFSGFKENDSFIFLSCHNPFELDEGCVGDGWAMWKELSKLLEKDHSIKCILMCGDQVYNDVIEKEYQFKKLKKHSINNWLIDKFILNYFKYWDNNHYRKVFSQIPSLCIWDDHDITDGWGTRSDFLDHENNISDRWKKYFEVAQESYMCYQHSRNHSFIPNIPQNVLSHYYISDSNLFYFLDLRSERNYAKKVIVSERHKNGFLEHLLNSIRSKHIRNVFILLPVIPFRTNFEGDKRLGLISKAILYVTKIIKDNERKLISKYEWIVGFFFILLLGLKFYFDFNNKLSIILNIAVYSLLALSLIYYFLKYFVSKIEFIGELTDDIEDGLSSSNLPFLVHILKQFFNLQDQQKDLKITILSGDIHLGGLTEILCRKTNPSKSILQIVSSPISNAPMKKAAAGLTTTTSEQCCDCNEHILFRNVFFTSKRNFVQIFPNQLANDNGVRPIKFYFEGHSEPICFTSKFND